MENMQICNETTTKCDPFVNVGKIPDYNKETYLFDSNQNKTKRTEANHIESNRVDQMAKVPTWKMETRLFTNITGGKIQFQ